MNVEIGKKYKYVIKNYTRRESRLKGISYDHDLGSYTAEIIENPKREYKHTLSGNMVYAKLISVRRDANTGAEITREFNKWIKKDLLVEEL